MSAKDDLDRLDRDWASHLQWRKGRRSFGEDAQPGEYRAKGPGYHDYCGIKLVELPDLVRGSFVANLEAIVKADLDARYQAIRAEMVQRALEEARVTLSELAGQPVAVEIPNTNTGTEKEDDCG